MGKTSVGVELIADSFRKRGLFARGLAPLRRGMLATLMVVSILYGSLIPFRFDIQKIATVQFGAFLFDVRDTTSEDIAVNVILYAAVATGLFSLARRKGAVEGIGVVLFCAMLSFGMEAMQALIPQRVSSATDFFLNLTGAFLGVAVCAVVRNSGQRLFQRITGELYQRPLHSLAIGISSALLAYHLVPFDFVTDTEQLHESFRRVQFFDLPTGLTGLAGEFSAVCWFAVIGFLVTRDSRKLGVAPVESMIEGFQHGLILACLIECLQLFTRSHVPEVLSAMIRATGALFGAWSAAFHIAQPRGGDRLFRAPTLFLAAMIQFFILALTVFCNLGSPPSANSTWRWSLPFKSLWLQPAPAAAASALSTAIVAFLLATTLAAAFRRAGTPRFGAASCWVVIGFYLVAEFITAIWGSHSFDPTDSILAALACGFALRAEKWFCLFQESCLRSPLQL